ncbi:Ribokinase-like protein [Schizopora paradoxa]|uniref:Adenosine kinase n=1 Tax=Schizopora paradoxa TaxID=27342 RepID=A0A0H2SFK0_9AGAM|nr:Ribokinase-like protein [Schizopora paradoxa]
MTASYPLFCMGNPLLDMQVVKGEELLKKYNLKANDAILAGKEQEGIYDDIKKNYEIKYLAGGAAQNAARGAAYNLPPNSVVYAGCVGDDEFAKELRAANAKEGLTDAYLVKKEESTGACAVVITGHNRSLCTTLRAAEKFELAHLSSPEVAPLIDAAKFFYVEGFFLTHGTESALYVAKKASEAGKVFVLNLSAPFIPQFFKTQLDQLIPYCDYIIGNDSEAKAWAEASGQPDKDDIPAIARAIALSTKSNSSRPRTVIITQGAESTVAVTAGENTTPKVYPVQALSDSEIVDTNGAGDAFAGGLLAALVSEKSLDDAVEIGHKMGSMSVQLSGPSYKWPKVTLF